MVSDPPLSAPSLGDAARSAAPPGFRPSLGVWGFLRLADARHWRGPLVPFCQAWTAVSSSWALALD
eukprot:15473834-Alexandrium_andersonii.AAC.1